MTPAIPPWYAGWVKSHLTHFAAYSPESAAAFALWWPDFEAIGATAAELAAATKTVLAMDPQPRTIANHYPAIRAAVIGGRAWLKTQRENARREANAQPLAAVWPADFLARVEAARR